MTTIRRTGGKNWKKEIDDLKQKYEELKAIIKKLPVSNNSQEQK